MNINVQFKIFKQRRCRYWILAKVDYGRKYEVLFADSSIMNKLGIPKDIYNQMALKFNGIIEQDEYIFERRRDIVKFKKWLQSSYEQYLVLKQLL